MTTCRGRLRLVRSALSLAVFYAGTAFAQNSIQCPQGQVVHTSYNPTGVVRTVVVPGSAGGLPSGVTIQPGFAFRMTAGGSIRVGVFGETGTPPQGWEPQGMAGNGYPSPDSYTFSLLYRIGNTGQWKMLGPGPLIAKLGPKDRPQDAQIQFGINDTKLNDNNGAFVVTLVQVAITEQCKPYVPVQAGPPMIGRAGTVKGRPAGGGGGGSAQLPCDGKTPDGQRQVFQFPLYCGGTFSRNIPIEACTRAEALPEAQAFARSSPPNCVLAP